MCVKGCVENAPSICLRKHCEFAEIFSDKMFCTNFAEWFDLTPVGHIHTCNSDCEWATLSTDEPCVECAKYGIPITFGDICRDEIDLFTPLNSKTNNQEVKADAGKPKPTLVPRQIIWDIAEVREYGNNKYPKGGPDNWKQVDVARYRDAAFRHFLAYLDNPDSVDEESGIKHLKHLACNIAFLCEMEAERRKDNEL